jgi:hypothetical protein
MPLNELNINIFKRLECNTIKKMLKIPKRCHSTSLLEALDIETTKSYCIRMKITIQFVLRLNNNEHTRKMIKYLLVATNRYLIPAYLFIIIKFQTTITNNNKVYKQVYYCINNIINDANNLFYFFKILMYFLFFFFVIHFFLRFNKNNNTRVLDVE